MSQKQTILDHLQAMGSVDPGTAYSQYGVYRLSAIIKTLRDAGYDITTTIDPEETGKRYALYTLNRPDLSISR